MKNNTSKPVVIWLLSGCLLIFLMVVIGGITRLTGSGLSITEWNVIMGAMPPLTDADWQTVFEKYKLSPQFRKVNFAMELSDFKFIFFWEYLHRLIGRVLGIVFMVPFLYFLLTKKLNRPLTKKLLFILFLGGFQGFLGWFMVKSGLVDRPAVSHYRLAAHLITAFLTCGYIFWVALGLMHSGKASADRSPVMPGFKNLSFAILLTVILQIVYGAFVAGLHAGKAYNTWPKMGEQWFPADIIAYDPAWLNFLENGIGVQFVHRYIAVALILLGAALYAQFRKNPLPSLKNAVHLFLTALGVRFTLGVITLLYAAPVTLSALHQTGGFALFMTGIYLYHRSKNQSWALSLEGHPVKTQQVVEA